MARSRPGFSLVELLIALGVVGILIALIMPAVSAIRGAANRLECQNHLKQTGLALIQYETTFGQFPSVQVQSSTFPRNSNFLGWQAFILPYLEQENLFKESQEALRIDPDPVHCPPHTGARAIVKNYVCPADSRLLSPLTDRYGLTMSFTDYIGIGGTIGFHGMITQPGTRVTEVTDGLSNTIMVSERPPPHSLQAGWWYPGYFGYGNIGPHLVLFVAERAQLYGEDPCVLTKPSFHPGRLANPCDRFQVWSLHGGGANFLFADGAVRFLPYSAHSLVPKLASRDGGEAVQLP